MSLQVRLALISAVVCVAWVLLTDQLLDRLAGAQPELRNLELLKDLLFVCVTAVALYFLLRSEFRHRTAREARLKASGQQFHDLFLNNPAPMVIIDPDTQRFVGVNGAALAQYGYSRAEFLALSASDIRSKEAAPPLDGLPRSERSRAAQGVEQHQRKNGERLIVEVASRPIDFDGRQALLQVIHNVTEQVQLQRELEATTRTVQTILNASPIAIYAVDRDFHVIFWSPAAEQLFGWTAAEIVGRELRNVPAEFRDEAAGFRARLLAGETLPVIEIERLRKDGTRLLIRNATAATRDHEGHITGILGISQDISAEKEAQKAMQRLASIVQASDESIIAITMDGKIASWNRGAERLFGYSAEEAVGQSLRMITPPDRVEGSMALLDSVQRGQKLERLEALGLTKDGRQVELSVNAFLIESEGPNASIALVSRDVTELKRVDRQLTYQANLLQNVSDAIVAVDTEWRVTSWNKAAEILYGWTADEVLGRQPDDFLHTEYMGLQPDQAIREMFETGHWHGEVVEYHKNGAPIQIFNSTSLLRDANGAIIGAVGIERDISLQRALAEETAARQHLQTELEREVEMRSVRSRFVSMVSHEFRTPLAAIQSSTDLLRHYGSRMSDSQRETHLGVVQQEVEHITELLNDFLTLSKMETVGVQFDPRPVELLALLRETVDTVLTSWPNRSVELFASGDCPPIPLDRKLIRQATLNLISNAIKYSPKETTVRIRLAFPQNRAEITVQDEGIGIPEPDQAHLFEQFYRATNVGATEGTGLGLAIVRRAVEAHGGMVSVQSSPGIGTTIGFTLPLTSEQTL